ncbi:MAG TPA: phosphotransferase [Chitinophagaceae bacterium]|nr:phosphotransferase [Chitinophagaceae bacterium]
MSNQVLVSCIIVLSNSAEHIEEAVDSILAQTYENWELLLVDDGSAIGSELAGKYAHQHVGKINHIPADNATHNRNALRNLGIKQSKGQFIGFLDPDDVWMPLKIEQQLSILDKFPKADMVYGAVQMWYSWTGNSEDGHLDYFRELGVAPNTMVEPPTLFLYLLPDQFQTGTISDALIRKTALDKLGIFHEAIQTIYDEQAFFAKLQLSSFVIVSDACWSKRRSYRKIDGALTEKEPSDSARLAFLNGLKNYLIEQEFKDAKVWKSVNAEIENHSIDKIENILLSHFHNLPITQINFLGEGLNNRAYRVNNHYIFKFPKHFHAETSLKKEILVLKALEPHLDFNIPKCEYVGNPSRLSGGTQFYKLRKITEKLKRLLSKVYPALSNKSNRQISLSQSGKMLFVGYPEIKGSFLYPEFLSKLPQEVQSSIAASIADFLKKMHSLPVSLVSHISLEVKDFGRGYYQYFLDLVQQIAPPHLTPSQSEVLFKWFDEFLSNPIKCEYKPTILHGDFIWDHILFDESENTLSGIIDFGAALIGDPAYDFVGIYTKYGEGTLMTVLTQYGTEHIQIVLQKVKMFLACECISHMYKGLKQGDKVEVEKARDDLISLLEF